MNRIVATMDDLPELPFEKVLSYLSLEDRLKARAVSRRWYHQINRFKVKSLCYSRDPIGFILGKSRWVSGAFAQNFISSLRFDLFFNTFSPTILSNLKLLRICNIYLRAEDNGASQSVSTLNLFGRLEELEELEELDLIDFTHPSAASGPDGKFELNLPMLTSVHLKRLEGIDQLTLDAPKLKKVKLLECSPSLRLEFVHADSVEWLAIDNMAYLPAKNLKSLKYLYCGLSSEIDTTFLSGLEQLKEVHLRDNDVALLLQLFEQKKRHGRFDLKIFLCGLLLNGPDDPFPRFEKFKDAFVHLIKNPSRLADEIPIWTGLPYTVPEGVAPESELNLLNRFTDLSMIVTDSSIRVQDVQRFLDLLKNLPNIVTLQFTDDQSQVLFDRLPEHSAAQYLRIDRPVSDLRFLFRLEHLLFFEYCDQIGAKVVRKAFGDLEFLWSLQFKHHNKQVKIETYSTNDWAVSIGEEETDVSDLNAAIQLVFGRTQKKKRNKRR